MTISNPKTAAAQPLRRQSVSAWLPAAFLAGLFVNAGAGLYLWLSTGLGAASLASLAIWAGWGVLAAAAVVVFRR